VRRALAGFCFQRRAYHLDPVANRELVCDLAAEPQRVVLAGALRRLAFVEDERVLEGHTLANLPLARPLGYSPHGRKLA